MCIYFCCIAGASTLCINKAFFGGGEKLVVKLVAFAS